MRKWLILFAATGGCLAGRPQTSKTATLYVVSAYCDRACPWLDTGFQADEETFPTRDLALLKAKEWAVDYGAGPAWADIFLSDWPPGTEDEVTYPGGLDILLSEETVTIQ